MKRYNEYHYNKALKYLKLERENYEDCFVDEKAFTRNRKLPFLEFIKVLLINAGTTLNQQLRIAQGIGFNRVSASAFIQQRDKLKPVFFRKLFENSLSQFNGTDLETLKGYTVLACDGSDVLIPKNPNDESCFIKCSKAGGGASLVHLNALTVEPSGIFADYVIEDFKKNNEIGACIEMLKRLREKHPKKKFLLTCDRGYESCTLMMWCDKLNIKYCLRGKDVTSNGISSKFIKESSTFDIYKTFKFTRSSNVSTKKGKEQFPDYVYVYSYTRNNNPFIPELDHKQGRPKKGEYKGPTYYEYGFRTVRFELPESSRHENKESHEVLLTNLSEDEFSVDELKDLYHMRWGIETNFRKLKYYDSAAYQHSKSKQVAINEIVTSMVFHNICVKALIIANDKYRKTTKVKKKDSDELELRVWKISYADLCQTMRIYICGRDPTATLKNIAKELQRTMICERKGRTFTRLIRHQSFIPYIYRAA